MELKSPPDFRSWHVSETCIQLDSSPTQLNTSTILDPQVVHPSAGPAKRQVNTAQRRTPALLTITLQRPLLSWLHIRPYQTTYQTTSRDRSQRYLVRCRTRMLLLTVSTSSPQQDTRCFAEERAPLESPTPTSSKCLSTRPQPTALSEESPSRSSSSKQLGQRLSAQGRRPSDKVAAAGVQRRLEGALDQAEEAEEAVHPNIPQSLKDSRRGAEVEAEAETNNPSFHYQQVGVAYREWIRIGATPWLVRQLRFG